MSNSSNFIEILFLEYPVLVFISAAALFALFVCVIIYRWMFPAIFLLAMPVIDIAQTGMGGESSMKTLLITGMCCAFIVINFIKAPKVLTQIDNLTFLVCILVGYICLGKLYSTDVSSTLSTRKVLFVIVRCLIPFLLARSYFYSKDNILKIFKSNVITAIFAACILSLLAFQMKSALSERIGISGSTGIIGLAQHSCEYIIIILVYLFFNYDKRKNVLNIAFFPALVGSFFTLFLTQSRGPLFSLALSLLAFSILAKVRFKTIITLILFIVSIVVIGMIVIGPDSRQDYIQRVSFSNKSIGDYSNRRLELNEYFWDYFFEHPLIGNGTASFSMQNTKDHKELPEGLDEQLGYPHNVFLELAYEHGIIGLSLFIGILILLIKNGRLFMRLEFLPKYIRITTIQLLILVFFFMQTSSHLGSYAIFWFMMGIISGACNMHRTNFLNGHNPYHPVHPSISGASFR